MGKDTFNHDSLLGGINMIKRRNNRILLEAGEKPPYPIIIDNPCLKDIFVNLNKADLGIVLFFTLMGSYYKLKEYQQLDLLLILHLQMNI